MDQKIDMPRAQSGTVAVLIPCYNEAVTIGKVVDDFRRVLPEATVYVYDNNSSDGTASIAAEHGAVVRAERRQGKHHKGKGKSKFLHGLYLLKIHCVPFDGPGLEFPDGKSILHCFSKVKY